MISSAVPTLYNAPVAHDGNAIAHPDGLVQIVGDEDGGLFHDGRQL